MSTLVARVATWFLPHSHVWRYAEKFVLKTRWQDKVISQRKLLAAASKLYLCRQVCGTPHVLVWWRDTALGFLLFAATASCGVNTVFKKKRDQNGRLTTQIHTKVRSGCICLYCSYTAWQTIHLSEYRCVSRLYLTVWLSCMSCLCHLFRLHKRSVLTRFS